ncbi:MAG: hypothetical protein KGL39_01610 [Patescibacteria group bacterium]|nr:hypothetical protein [Patescibacteria group bacterium]
MALNLGDTLHDLLAGDDGEDAGLLAAAEAKTGSAGEAAKAPSETLLDLNDEKAINAAGLEDPGLRDHMSASRGKIAGEAPVASVSERLTRLTAGHTDNLRKSSAIITSLSSALKTFQTTNELVFLQSSNAGKLAAGSQPHGFPKDPVQSMKHLQAKIKEAAEAHDKTYTELRTALNNLTVLRRDYEAVVDGLVDITKPLKGA